MSIVNGKKTVYDLQIRLGSRKEAEETYRRFSEALRGNVDYAETRLGIFYHGGKTIRVIEFEDSSTHVNVYRLGNGYSLKVLKEGEPKRRPV